MMRPKYKLYDAFETKGSAVKNAIDLRKSGMRMSVKKIAPQAGGRLKWGIFSAGFRKKRR